MLKSRTETAVALIVLAVGLLIAAILGLWGYMGVTATPLHPAPQEVQSVLRGTPSSDWAGAIASSRQAVRAALAEQNLPGLSVAVGANNDIVWAEGFGWADLEKRTPLSPDMRFRIGTASTPLTAAAAGLLLERGRLTLDDPIQKHVPEFPGKPWPVTLRQVMGHVAGLRNDGGDEGPLLAAHCERPAEALKAFADSALLFEPGTRYSYSSYGYILVSAAIEAAAEEPFLRFMKKQIFEPLGMNDTMADNTRVGEDGMAEHEPEPIPNQVTAYFPRFAGDPNYGLHLMRPIDYSCYAGASVFLSTPSDLVRFGMAINGGKQLRPATVQLLQTSQKLTSGEETGYGLGWDLENVTLAGSHTHWIGHEGTLLGGMVTSLMTFPERGLVIAVMSNISYAETEALALKIAQAFAEQARSPASK